MTPFHGDIGVGHGPHFRGVSPDGPRSTFGSTPPPTADVAVPVELRERRPGLAWYTDVAAAVSVNFWHKKAHESSQPCTARSGFCGHPFPYVSPMVEPIITG